MITVRHVSSMSKNPFFRLARVLFRKYIQTTIIQTEECLKKTRSSAKRHQKPPCSLYTSSKKFFFLILLFFFFKYTYSVWREVRTFRILENNIVFNLFCFFFFSIEWEWTLRIT